MRDLTFHEKIADAKRDSLDDFASERLLPVLAGGEVTRERLLRAMADSEHAARETFRQWADEPDEEADSEIRKTFAAVAQQEDEHRDRVLNALDEPYEPNDGGPLHTYLRSREDTVQRLASGLIARPLVSIASYDRLVEHFEGRHEDAASLARDLRAETEDVIADGNALLATHCDDESDWERARMTATYTIQVAHDDFRDASRSVNVDLDS